MNAQGIFKARYPVLKGRDWVRRIDPEDRVVFVSIGMEANLHGVIGGQRLAQKKGRAYMAKIGRIGAIVANSKRAWNKALVEEMWREGIMR
jgi:hypothetical protein